MASREERHWVRFHDRKLFADRFWSILFEGILVPWVQRLVEL
jgi:hypothetical protein